MRWRPFCKANDYFLKVFAVSKKVHTTRSRALGVLTEDDTQIVRTFSCLLSMSVIMNNAILKKQSLKHMCVCFVDFTGHSWSHHCIKGQKVPFFFFFSFLFSSFFL